MSSNTQGKLMVAAIAAFWILAILWPKEPVDPSDCKYYHGARVLDC